MRKFRVKVDGREYIVEVAEEGAQGAARVTEEGAEVREEQRQAPTTHIDVPSGGNVTAPIAGKILKTLIKEGEHVEEGKVLFVLEAMKMENEIYAPKTGTVKKIYVKEGENVEESQPLCDIV